MKIVKKIKIQVDELLFYCGLMPLLAQYMFSVTSDRGIKISGTVDTILLLLGLFFWGIVIFKKNSLKDFLIKVLIFSFLMVNQQMADTSLSLITFMMIFASEGIPYEKIIKFMFVPFATLLTYCITFYGYNMAMGKAVVTKYRTIDGVSTARHGFYFNQPNSFSLVLFFTVMMFTYLYYNKIKKWIIYLVMVVTSIFIYIYPNTKTVSFMFFFLILVDWVGTHHWDKIPKFLKNHATVIIFVLNILIVMVYRAQPGNKILREIDDLFTWRLRACVSAYDTYGISILGQSSKQSLMGYNYMCIDNVYWALIINYGVIVAFMYFYPLAQVIWDNEKYKKEWLCVLAMLLYGFTECVICPLYAFPVLFARDYLVRGKKKKHYEQKISCT